MRHTRPPASVAGGPRPAEGKPATMAPMSALPARLGRLTTLGWPARYPIVQFPNAPLLVALAAAVAGRLTGGDAHRVAQAAFYLALAIWAYEELSDGVNAVRRGLGAAVLVYLVVRLAGAL